MAASILTRLLAYSSLVVVVCSFTGVHGRTIQLNWTADGVRDYMSTPLMLNLGDTLELTCRNISNVFIQTDRTQYDSCNASASSGVFTYNGFCFSGSSLRITLTENSQNLDNTVNFENNRVYFLTSYSEGSFRRNDATFTSGGQCEDGLKMIFVIGQITVPPVDGGSGDDSGGKLEVSTTDSEIITTDSSTSNESAPNTPMDDNISCMCHYETTIIIAFGSGLSILFIILIAVVLTAIFIFVGSKKKPQRESDVYYDTVNIGHQPPVIETELNIAYGHPKKLK